MKKQMPQPQDLPELKGAWDILRLITKAVRAKHMAIIMGEFGYSHANQRSDTVSCEAKS